MENEYSVGRESEKEPKKHIKEGVVGKVIYRIYRNVNEKTGEFLDFKFKLLRREGNESKRWAAKSFFHEDMSDVAKAATASYIWLRDNTSDYEIRPFPDAFPIIIPVNESAEKPVYEVQFGSVLASVWENMGLKSGKLYHKFGFRRVEQVGEVVFAWNSFRPEDSRHLSQAATHCRIWYQRNVGSVQRLAVTEEGEKNRPAKRKPRRAAK